MTKKLYARAAAVVGAVGLATASATVALAAPAVIPVTAITAPGSTSTTSSTTTITATVSPGNTDARIFYAVIGGANPDPANNGITVADGLCAPVVAGAVSCTVSGLTNVGPSTVRLFTLNDTSTTLSAPTPFSPGMVITVVRSSPAVYSVSASPATATGLAGAGFSIAVQVTDANGNGISGVTPSFSVSGANAAAVNSCPVSDVNGSTSCTYANPNAGGDSVRVWVNTPAGGTPGYDAGEPSSTVSRTTLAGPPGVPASVQLTPAALSVPVGGVATFTATVLDANGGPVSGATAVFSATGAAIVNSTVKVTGPAGTATFAIVALVPGQAIVYVNASGFGASSTLTITPAPIVGVVTVSVPPNVVVQSPAGRAVHVSYTASAVDSVSGVLPVTCTPKSGAEFHLGTTTVSCVATNSAGTSATNTFTVTVVKKSEPAKSRR